MKQSDSVKIIYCDNHLLVVEKPNGISTQPDLEILAKDWVKKQFQKTGNVFLHPIHRLDKVAGGIVVFARTSKALSRLQESMRKKEFIKVYYAIVEGHLSVKKGILKHNLKHSSFHAKIDPQGKEAILEYQIESEKKDRSLLKIILETGRYHQIRIQFSTIGHPILGDQKYGSQNSLGEAIALHHFKIQFCHPVTHKQLTFVSPLTNLFSSFDQKS